MQLSVDDRQATVRQSEILWWIVAIATGLVLLGLFFPFHAAHWSGRKVRLLSIAVVDSETGISVPGADIMVFYGLSEIGVGIPAPEPDLSDARTISVSADADGRATIGWEFEAYGHSSTFENWGRVRFGTCYVRVRGREHEPFQLRLGEQIGETGDFHDNSPIELRVALQRTKVGSQSDGVSPEGVTVSGNPGPVR